MPASASVKIDDLRSWHHQRVEHLHHTHLLVSQRMQEGGEEETSCPHILGSADPIGLLKGALDGNVHDADVFRMEQTAEARTDLGSEEQQVSD